MLNLTSSLTWAGRPMKSGSIFDPTTLPLTLYCRAPYSGSPWSGTNSLGGSGSRTLSETTNPPSVGTAVNGKNPAHFDAINDILTNASSIGTILGASQYLYWFVAKINTINGSNADNQAFNNCAVVSDSSSFIGAHLSIQGANPRFQFYHWDGSAKVVPISISTGQYLIAMCRHTGTELRARVNSGSISSIAAGALTNTNGTIRVGRGGSMFCGMDLLEIGMMDQAGSDDIFDGLLEYVDSAYNLNL